MTSLGLENKNQVIWMANLRKKFIRDSTKKYISNCFIHFHLIGIWTMRFPYLFSLSLLFSLFISSWIHQTLNIHSPIHRLHHRQSPWPPLRSRAPSLSIYSYSQDWFLAFIERKSQPWWIRSWWFGCETNVDVGGVVLGLGLVLSGGLLNLAAWGVIFD